MNKSIKNKIISIIIIICIFLIGFYCGKSFVTIKEDVSYEKLPPVKLPDVIIDTLEITYTVPIESEISKKEIAKLQKSNDSLKNQLNIVINKELLLKPTEVDENKLWTAYVTKNTTKNKVMFDIDTIGKYTVSYDVQYNNLQSFYNIEFEPVQRTVTKTIEKKFIPFGYITGTTNGDLGLGIGTFHKDLGISGDIEYNAFNNKVNKKEWYGRLSLYKNFK